ncbi:MAG: hypothetical protein ACRDFX_05785 [Chloroflexota bacterium]
MTQPKQISFDSYLDTIFAGGAWLEACVNMLSVFLEDIDSCRDEPGKLLPGIAPSIVDQVAAVADRARHLQAQHRSTAEQHGPEAQTAELGAILWWAGMASHQAGAALTASRDLMERNAWDEAFIQINVLMYDTISSLSLLSISEEMVRLATQSRAGERPN